MADPPAAAEPALPTVAYLLEQQAERGLHLGAQVYASLRGQAVAEMAVGESKPGVAMTPDTVNLWMSCTKPVTAIAVAQQVEAHDLDLATPVAYFIPEFAEHGKDAITLEHLLTHTAGIRPTPFDFPRDDWETILASICAMRPEPHWVPGEQAGYHVYSTWFLLAEVVQRLTGEPFDRYVREQIFEPLDMDDAWLGMDPAAYDRYGDRLGHMFDTEGGAVESTDYDQKPYVTRTNPGGNGFGPARELGRFFEMLLAGGRLGVAKLLEPATVRRFTGRQRVGMHDRTFNHTVDWGLGLIVSSNRYGSATVPYGFGPHASEQTFGHGGRQSSIAFADPQHELVAVVLTNGMPGEAKHHKRMRDVCKAIYEDLGLA
jgi:CubicO group peptidase (beta-lactamase class C family)